MNTPSEPVDVAILAFAETTASVTFGMYDLLMAAGRDWGFVVDGHPGPVAHAPAHRVGATRGRSLPPTTCRSRRRQRSRMRPTPASCASPSWRCRRRIRWQAASPRRSRGCGAATRPARRSRPRARAPCCWPRPACSTDTRRRRIGRTATSCAARYPRVRVRKERALVVSGEGQRLVMAGGGTSWQDLALYLIARFAGVDAAMHVARVNLIDWHAIGQQPFAHLARSRQVEDAEIARCQAWIAHHYDEPSPVSAMVRLSGLAERSFKRRFQQATGMPPLEYVHTLRLEEAKQMLESSDGVDRGDRQRDRLRGRGFLQPPVPPQGGPDAGTVSAALRIHAPGADGIRPRTRGLRPVSASAEAASRWPQRGDARARGLPRRRASPCRRAAAAMNLICGACPESTILIHRNRLLTAPRA